MSDKYRIIVLPDDEAELAREAAAAMVQAEQQLGRARANFILEEASLMNGLMERSKEYQDLQAMLLKKNRKEPGQYQLVPEIGAFVEVPSIGTRGNHGNNSDPSQEPQEPAGVDRREDQQRPGDPGAAGAAG